MDVDLSSLHEDLASCTFNDPGLLEDNGALYLATQCQVFTSEGENAELEFVALCSAPIGLDAGIENLAWT